MYHQNDDKMVESITLQEALLANGYVHIPYAPRNNLEQIIAQLGKVIQKTEIREHSSSTRLLCSNQSMGFHNDHNAAKYIAWFCNSQSATGGESLLIDTTRLLREFSEYTLSLLEEITVKTHKVFYDDKLSLPLLNQNELTNVASVFYSQWLVNTPSCIKHKKALDKFEAALATIEPIQILLSEGDILVIDNHRMLHGRTGFPAESDRWLTRFWIK